MQVRCDGLEAIKLAKRKDEKELINISYFDLVSTLKKLISNSISKYVFDHVKRYRNECSTRLTIWEELDMVVDM